MKKLSRDASVHIIAALIGVIIVFVSLLVESSAVKNTVISVGASVIASSIVSFLILFFVGNPFDEIVKSIKSTTAEFNSVLETNVDIIALASKAGLQGIWSSRSDLAAVHWIDRLNKAKHEVFIIAFAMEFLSEHEAFIPLLQERAKQGCRVRLLMGDPDGVAVASRNREERREGSIRSRVETTLTRLAPIVDGTMVILKVHDVPLYCAIYSFDNEMIVTPHLYGLRGASAPTLIITKTDEGLFTKYKKHFEDVWNVSNVYVAPEDK